MIVLCWRPVCVCQARVCVWGWVVCVCVSVCGSKQWRNYLDRAVSIGTQIYWRQLENTFTHSTRAKCAGNLFARRTHQNGVGCFSVAYTHHTYWMRRRTCLMPNRSIAALLRRANNGPNCVTNNIQFHPIAANAHSERPERHGCGRWRRDNGQRHGRRHRLEEGRLARHLAWQLARRQNHRRQQQLETTTVRIHFSTPGHRIQYLNWFVRPPSPPLVVRARPSRTSSSFRWRTNSKPHAICPCASV